ncbi:hypothetical protein DL770_004384 [Monosporascus sp. CRB-9-2]|nr:hypothetical protein DL770_004384 [Monosporascus sp. CRB-9-2]
MDDTLPLLSDPDCQIGERYDEQNGKDIVDFDPKGDAENPMEWPVAYKWSIVALLALTAFTVTFTCCAVVPIANRIVDDLDGAQSSKSASVLLVTIWELGEAAGPLLIGPLSEVFGRYPVINVSNVLFIAATVLAAVCQSSSLLVGARALTGLAVATNVLSPAIVGDIFLPERRGTAMSFIQMAPLLGGAIGPAISGAITEQFGWRRVIWMSVALASFCEVVFLSFFRETYRVPILRRKAARLRRETGNDSLKTVFDIEGRGLLQNDIMGDIYHLTPALIGSAFMCFSVGSFVTVVFCNLMLDTIYVRMRDANRGIGQPEYRLPPVIAGGFLLPVVIVLYGWVPELRLPLPYSLLSVVLMGTTLMLGFLPLMTYVVDAFGLYSASAMTALIVTSTDSGDSPEIWA